MQDKHKKILIFGGVVLAGAALVYFSFNKKTSKPITNSKVSFNGDTCTCGLFPTCSKKRIYTQQDIGTASDNLVKNGATRMEATQMINNAMNQCQPISQGELCKQLAACNGKCGCGGFCLCNPSKNIEWYNPLTWHW